MLNEAHDIVLLRELDEIEMVLQQLDGRFCHQDMHTMLDGSLCDGIVRIWW